MKCRLHPDVALVCPRCERARIARIKSPKRAAASRLNGRLGGGRLWPYRITIYETHKPNTLDKVIRYAASDDVDAGIAYAQDVLKRRRKQGIFRIEIRTRVGNALAKAVRYVLPT